MPHVMSTRSERWGPVSGELAICASIGGVCDVVACWAFMTEGRRSIAPVGSTRSRRI